MKRLLLTLSLVAVLAGCADRTRENCETTKETGLFERRCK
jgi:hypothetical protein